MREELLHYIWANRLYNQVILNGKAVDIIDTGIPNDSDGPDFLLAKVKVDGLTWIGAVEIHRKASEWIQHGHQHDPNYNSVVLHIVTEADKEVTSQNGHTIPTAVMETSPEIFDQLNKLQIRQRSLRCMPEFMIIGDKHLKAYVPRLLKERLQRKLGELRSRSSSDLHAIFFMTLMHYMGGVKNNHVMEQVAPATPYNILKKHANQLQSLEAILIGQAGLISEYPRDDYEKLLLEEYRFYRQKFNLTPIPADSFNRLRIRPVAFPTRRLAMVAQWLQQSDTLLSAFAASDRVAIENIFALPPSDYWLSHYDFALHSDRKLGALGKQSRLTMLINVIVPTTYYYAVQRGDELAAKQAISWLYEMPAEVNTITTLFTSQGVKIQNAAESQALIELYRSYCEKYHCLSCPIATEIFQTLRDQ